jgi:hypothetical protein
MCNFSKLRRKIRQTNQNEEFFKEISAKKALKNYLPVKVYLKKCLCLIRFYLCGLFLSTLIYINMYLSKFGLLLFVGFFPTLLQAQCSELSLNTLQVIQSATPDEKETKILEAGFDLRQAKTGKGNVTKVYSKCWATSGKKKDYYEQKLLWDSSNDSIKFAMLNEQQFQNLRKVLDERHPSGVGSAVVVGKKFTYYLGSESIEGVDYYTIMLIKK